MPAPKRIRNWVLILSPVNGGGIRDAVALGRQACRAAHQRGLEPIFPLLYCLGFMTDEEVAKGLPQVTARWARRVSRIWLCGAPSDTDVDPVTHDVLLNNEGHMNAKVRYYLAPTRLPVQQFWALDNGVSELKLMERSDIDMLLMRSIKRGLFRSAVVAE
jgi:hypothetical protein